MQQLAQASFRALHLRQHRLCRREIGLSGVQCVELVLWIQPADQLANADTVANIDKALGQLAVDTEGEVHFILRPDLPGQRDRLADDVLLDDNRADGPNRRWCRCGLCTGAEEGNSKDHAACACSHLLHLG